MTILSSSRLESMSTIPRAQPSWMRRALLLLLVVVVVMLVLLLQLQLLCVHKSLLLHLHKR